MIQLKVYNSPAKLEQFWLDLYETEPIKLTLSIEDIQNADATSTYSKSFKVPGTRKNAEFFKNSFDVDQTIFDVTIKKPAEILVDGAEFKQGHIRLQKVYLNTELDRYDYELLFLGETRDFSSIIGDRGLCELQMPDLIGGTVPGSEVSAADIVTSWNVYPQSASLTAGLHNGNILYPLIDHGNSYNGTGTVQQTRIALDGPRRFTQAGNPLTVDRFKPMIRAKRIWDQIFDDAGYTYTSDFIDSDLFHQIYISAFGNKATVGWDIEASSPTSDNVAHAQENNSYWGPQFLSQAINDPGNNLSVVQFNAQPITVYTVPSSGEYQFAGQAFYYGANDTSNGYPIPLGATVFLYNITQSIPVASSPFGFGQTLQFNVTLDTTTTAFLNVGDQLVLVVGSVSGNGPDNYSVTNVALDVISAPGLFNPVTSLECTYKQIDFVKDILTAFRLVLSPDPNNPQNFIVEPWQQYINSGNLHNWSKKLVENKDVTIEPVFFTQNAEIEFKFQPGGDYVNVYHQQAYSEPYGYLQFNANNDLLKGKREIKLIGIAPTPVANIEGGVEADAFVIPQIHTHSPEDTGLQHLPIKPKTRMLFYDGLKPVPVHPWYLLNGTGSPYSVYPMVSPYQVFPIQNQTLNLNWANDIKYWTANPTTAGTNGVTLYDNYWSRYINALYGKYSRRVTAYFVLNNIDLNDFSFDDTIFVNGTYYIPEKIIDVEIGAYTEVKVQLLTANDYRPSVIPNQILFVNSITGVGGPCALGPGSIDINTNGTPGFSWSLSNGQSGSALTGATPGAASYDFTISNVSPGTYTITITDSLGRVDTQTVIVPESIATLVIANQIVTPESECGACDGSIDVTPSGGTGPYSIEWSDLGIPGTLFTRTGLCSGTYSYTVYDSLRCAQQSYVAEVTCESAPGDIWEFWRSSNDCQQILLSPQRRVFYPTGTTPTINAFYKLTDLIGNELRGCWVAVQIVTQPADAFELADYQTCAECQGFVAETWVMENCETQETVYAQGPGTMAINQVWNINGLNGCWIVKESTTEVAFFEVSTGPYSDCNDCAGIGGEEMLSNKLPLGGAQEPVCSDVHPFAIYNSETIDPYSITIGSVMYTDVNLTNPWNGGNTWYSIARVQVPNVAAVTVFIRTDGVVEGVEFCS